MPTSPRRPCTYPGCGTLVESGRCARHRNAGKRKRPSSSAQGYDDRWRELSQAYRKAHPHCEIRRYCRGAPSTEVDHRIPKAQGGTDSWRNLQAACHRCHSWKTSTESRRDDDGRFSSR